MRQAPTTDKLLVTAATAANHTISGATMSCRTASANFTNFLNNYQGQIPGWTGHQIVPGCGTHTNNRTRRSFTVKHD